MKKSPDEDRRPSPGDRKPASSTAQLFAAFGALPDRRQQTQHAQPNERERRRLGNRIAREFQFRRVIIKFGCENA